MDDLGRPLLSWRVAILPLLGHEDLYEEFHLDEPWDGGHDLPLISRMPAYDACPSSTAPLHAGRTTCLAAAGAGMALDQAAAAAGIPRSGFRPPALYSAATRPAGWTRTRLSPRAR